MHTCQLNPYAARRILWAGDRTPFPLQPLSCTYQQAADLICDNITNLLHGPTGNPPLDPFQSIKDDWNTHSLSDLQKIVQHPWLLGKTTEDLLLVYFGYFNSMIFSGALNDLRCTFELAEPDAEQKEKRILGTTIDLREGHYIEKHNVKTHLKVFIRQQPPPQNVDESVQLLRDYLGTMLHEMIHAFFSLYVCKCDTKCRRTYLAYEQSGLTGHGEPFLRAARSIERLMRYGLRIDIKLGRAEALGLELVLSDKGIWFPDLDALGLSEDDVKREMDWFESLVEVADAREMERERQAQFEWDEGQREKREKEKSEEEDRQLRNREAEERARDEALRVEEEEREARERQEKEQEKSPLSPTSSALSQEEEESDEDEDEEVL